VGRKLIHCDGAVAHGPRIARPVFVIGCCMIRRDIVSRVLCCQLDGWCPASGNINRSPGAYSRIDAGTSWSACINHVLVVVTVHETSCRGRTAAVSVRSLKRSCSLHRSRRRETHLVSPTTIDALQRQFLQHTKVSEQRLCCEQYRGKHNILDQSNAA